jgi:hypothetical protein
MNVTREDLQFLANQPLGAPHLQKEAERVAGHGTPSAELKELCKRVSKKFLPLGKTTPKRGACNEPTATQTDIEDAVEAAGGARGGKAA